MDKTENNHIKYVDTHIRVNTDLRTFLENIQEFYNTQKHKDTPAISINTLCNISIFSLRDQLDKMTDKEKRLYLSKKAGRYDSLRAITEYTHEFEEKEEI